MPRQSKQPPLTIGVIGGPNTDLIGIDGVEALLDNWMDDIDPEREVLWVVTFPEETSDTLGNLLDLLSGVDEEILAIAAPDVDLLKEYDLGEDSLVGPAHVTPRVYTRLVEVLADADPDSVRCIVLWDDDDREMQMAAVKLAKAGIPLFEMSSALVQIEALDVLGEDDDDDETTPPPSNNTTEEKEPPMATDDTPEEEGDEFVPYTRDELEEVAADDRDKLKLIAADFEIDVTPRARSTTIIDAILDAQENLLEEPESDAEDDEGEEDSPEPEEAPAAAQAEGIDIDAIVAAVVEETGTIIEDMSAPILEAIGELREAVEALQKAPPAPEPKKDAPARRRPPKRV